MLNWPHMARDQRLHMTTRHAHRRAFLQLLLAACVLPVRGAARQDKAAANGSASADARPTDITSIPRTRFRTRSKPRRKIPSGKPSTSTREPTVRAPRDRRSIWFNARHDGITLEAVGDVILTAANAEIADARATSHPAVVNHVVYFGDGVSRKTVLRGFKITGARNFTTGSGEKSPIESDDLRKTAFFYTDGGGIKIYARSYPTIESVEVYENYASPCGGGVSVEHLGQTQDSALFRNCIFRNNGTQTTGAARRSSARQRRDDRELPLRRQRVEHGRRLRRPVGRGRVSSGAWLGRHDGVRRIARHGQQEHVHRQLVGRRRQRQGQHLRRFDLLEEHARAAGSHRARATSSTSPTAPASADRSSTARSTISGGRINKDTNTFDPPDPRFDAQFAPRAPQYAASGISAGQAVHATVRP